MKLRKYLNTLSYLVERRPEVLDYEVITAKDAEGNGFDKINFEPTIGIFYADEKEFETEENLIEEGGDFKLNAVCVN